MKTKTKAYLAGVFDAEGCLCINQWQDSNECQRFGIYLDITNKERSVIQWITNHFGGSLKKISARLPNSDRHEYYYNWRIKEAKHLTAVLDSIEPYLLIKKTQVRVCRDYLSLANIKDVRTRKSLYLKLRGMKQEGVTTEMLDRFEIKILRPYLSGFFDGEGSVSATLTHKRLSCSNTCREVLDIFQKHFGGTISADKLLPNKKASFHWQLYKKSGRLEPGRLEQCILAILPYSIVKRKPLMDLLMLIRNEKIQSELHGDMQSEPAGTLNS